MKTQKTRMITGTSRRLGSAITGAVLRSGDRAITTLRNKARELTAPFSNHANLFVLTMNLTNGQQAKSAVRTGPDQLARIDTITGPGDTEATIIPLPTITNTIIHLKNRIMKKIIKLSMLTAGLALFTAFAHAQHQEPTGFKMPPLNPKSKLADISGNHVGIRVPDYAAAIKWYTEKLDFRIIHEWDYADEKLAYLAPANNNGFWLEVLAGGKLQEQTAYSDLGKSLEAPGYHHFCVHVTNLDKVLTELKKRGVNIIGDTFYLEAITRKLAFIQDPWGNMIELAEVVAK